MNEMNDVPGAAAPAAKEGVCVSGAARRGSHHWLCDGRGFNELCIGCEAERASHGAGALVTPDVDGAPCSQCGVAGSHLCKRSGAQLGATCVKAAQSRPADDHLWDATLRDRDTYHEWADKLANAIGSYFGVDIGEHSNANCPWAEALEAIETQLALLHGELPDSGQAVPASVPCAPWTDFNEQPIHLGDTIQHPDGSTAVVKLDPYRQGYGAWRAAYANGDSLWLGNQIGDNGRAVVIKRPATPTDAALD